jgi:hypothetical protein
MICCGRLTDQIALAGILSEFQPPPLGFRPPRSIGEEVASQAARTGVLIRVAALTNLARATARYIPSSSTDAITVRNRVRASRTPK